MRIHAPIEHFFLPHFDCLAVDLGGGCLMPSWHNGLDLNSWVERTGGGTVKGGGGDKAKGGRRPHDIHHLKIWIKYLSDIVYLPLYHCISWLWVVGLVDVL